MLPVEMTKAPFRPKVAGRIAFFFGPLAGDADIGNYSEALWLSGESQASFLLNARGGCRIGGCLPL